MNSKIVPILCQKYLKIGVNFALIVGIWALLSSTVFFSSGFNTGIRFIGNRLGERGFFYRRLLKTNRTILANSAVHESLISLARNTSPQNRPSITVLLVLESFGASENKAVTNYGEQELSKRLKAVLRQKKDYRLEKEPYEFPFLGTLGAELRFLCNIRTEEDYYNLLEGAKSSIDKKRICVTDEFKKASVPSFYFHAGDKNFYNRSHVMRTIGFQGVVFPGRPTNWQAFLFNCISKPFCASDDIMFLHALDFIKGLSESRKSAFVTIMTIDTHSPYTGRMQPEQAYIEKVQKAAKMVAGLIDSLTSLYSYDELNIYITSDHPPPLNIKTTSLPNDPRVAMRKVNFVYYITNSISR